MTYETNGELLERGTFEEIMNWTIDQLERQCGLPPQDKDDPRCKATTILMLALWEFFHRGERSVQGTS